MGNLRLCRDCGEYYPDDRTHDPEDCHKNQAHTPPVTRPSSDAVKLMYTALMQIAFVSTVHFGEHTLAMDQTKKIAERAISEMNTKHTALVQQALGIGED